MIRPPVGARPAVSPAQRFSLAAGGWTPPARRPVNPIPAHLPPPTPPLPATLPPPLGGIIGPTHAAAIQQALLTGAPLPGSGNTAALSATPDPWGHLDAAQRAAVLGVSGDDAHSMIVGGPGTGKTDVLIAQLKHLITSGKVRPDQVVALSALRSGRNVLTQRLARLRAELPGGNRGNRLHGAHTFEAMALSIMGHGAIAPEPGSKERTFYPAWEGAGYHGYQGILYGQEHEDFVRQQIANLVQEQRDRSGIDSYAMPPEKEIGEFLHFISNAKSNRTDLPDNLFDSSLLAGEGHLALMRQYPAKLALTQEAVLAHVHAQQQAAGLPDYLDALYPAGERVRVHGIDALPARLREARVFANDEAQDSRHVAMTLLGRVMESVKHNSPRLLLALDPRQALIPEAFGAIGHNSIIGAISQMVARFTDRSRVNRYNLVTNWRSDRGAREWNNAIAGSEWLKDEQSSPEQTAGRTDLGAYPHFIPARTQIQQYQQMLRQAFARAGVSFETIRQNVAMGQHPFAGIAWQSHPNGNG